MKAITYDVFGGLDVLHLRDVSLPPLAADRIEVRVAAVSINPIDGKIRRGELKLMSGTHFPKETGMDFAGTVIAMGASVTGFAVGDEIYGGVDGLKHGALSQNVHVPAKTISLRPSSIDAGTAASVPLVASAALQALRDVADVKPGMRVLINGCTGGVGLFALQIAKKLGAHVTGVCGSEGLALSADYGADVVLDYRQDDVLNSEEHFDVIFDLSGQLAFGAAQVVLADHGVYIDPVPTPAGLIANTIANPFRNHKHRFLMSSVNTADLEILSGWLDSGELRPSPVREFRFDDFREAYAAAEGGPVIGKIVIRV